MVLDILVFILLCFSLMQLFLGVYAFSRRKSSPVALSFAGFLFALSLYAGGYAGELYSTTLPSMVTWNTIQYLGISFLPALWIIVTARYVNFRWISTPLILFALLALGFVTLFGALTDPVLHLRYASVAVNRDGPFPVLVFSRGPIYWMHVAFSFIAFAFSTVVYVWNFITATRFFRRQQFFMLVGSVIPWINYAFYLQGAFIPGLDTVPFSMFIVILCFSTSIFGFRILDVVPVARGLVFEAMSDGVIVLDMSDRVVDYNRSASAVFPELDASSFSKGLKEVLRGYPAVCESIDVRDSAEFQFTLGEGGAQRFYQCRFSDIESRAKVPVGRLLLFKDNTDSTLLLEKLQELATIDPLTRIFNRRHFLEQTARQLSWLARDGQPLSIIILDIDHFKRINDTFGHLAGDEVLKSIATTIVTQLRGVDIAARFGGEEFICLLPQASAGDAFTIAERIRETIRKTFVDLDGSPHISVSASFGVYSVARVQGDENIDSLIARADAALYRAKRSGRNRTVLFNPGMEEVD
jgi:diguanylate cyclase (GGDEF)-like protein